MSLNIKDNMEQEMKKIFQSGNTELTRENIFDIGFRGDKVSDEMMQFIADELETKMIEEYGVDWEWTDEYVESVWWNELDELCYLHCEFVGEYN